jgi:hypothetical protein
MRSTDSTMPFKTFQTLTILYRGKYNTVKLWYKRTFPGEWDSADKRGGIKENQQPIRRPRLQQQTEIPYQQQAGDSLQITQAFFHPQHQQGNFRSPQNGYGRQESASIIDSPHPQGSHQHQQDGDAPQLHHYQNVIRQCQAGTYDPLAHMRFYHSTFDQVGPKHHRCMPHRASDPLTQHNDSQYQSNHYISYLPTEAADLSDQQDPLHYQQCGSFQQIPAEANDRGYQTSPNSLPQSNNLLSRGSQQSSSVFEENSINGDWLLGDFPGLYKKPINLDIPVDNQQLNIQDNAAAWQPNQASQHQRPNPPQHVNHQSVPHSPADPLTMSSGNDQSYSTPNPQQLNCSFEGQHGTLQSAAESYRSNSIFNNPAQAPLNLLHRHAQRRSLQSFTTTIDCHPGSSMATLWSRLMPMNFLHALQRNQVKLEEKEKFGIPSLPAERYSTCAMFQRKVSLKPSNLVQLETPQSTTTPFPRKFRSVRAFATQAISALIQH